MREAIAIILGGVFLALLLTSHVLPAAFVLGAIGMLAVLWLKEDGP